MRLTVCVVAQDEAQALPRCLASVAGWADEVLVADVGSRDGTAAAARGAGAAVVALPASTPLAAARNALLERAGGDWVLVLDADEELELAPGANLRDLLGGSAPAYRIPVLSPSGPALAGRTYVSHPVRLFRRDGACRYTGDWVPDLPAEAAGGAQPAPDGVRIRHRGLLPGESERRARRLRRRLSGRGAPPLAVAFQDIRLGQYGRALARLARVPDDPSATYWLAFCQRQVGQVEEALATLAEGCRRWPGFTDLELLRGECLMALGRWAEAEAAWRRCLDLGDAGPAYGGALGAGGHLAWAALARLQAATGNLAAAAESLAAAYRAFPDDPEPLYGLAHALASLGQARRIPGRLAALVPGQDVQKLLLRADVLMVQRLFGPALQALNAAVRLTPSDPEARHMRGRCLLMLGRPAEAAADLAAVPEDHPLYAAAARDRVLAAWCTGDCRTAAALLAGPATRGLKHGARAAWRAAHRLICRGEDLHRVVGGWGRAGGEVVLAAVDALLAAGLPPLAQRVARLMDRMGWPEGYKLLGLTCRLRGRREMARAEWERALAAGVRDPDVLCWLAEQALARRDWPRAHALAGEAAALAPASPVPHLLRARIFRAQALELVRLGLRQDPADAELQAILARLGGDRP